MSTFPQTGVELVAQNAGRYISDITRASRVTDRFTSSLQTVGSVALKAGAAGLAAVGAGFAGAATAGLQFNSTMENVEAQLFAFLKDGEAVADALSLIETRAAQTPFAFEDMARATASLIPAAKQSGKEIEELISVAEILAASNPAEGLEGAAFSLREALSGDFVSIVERFNLPRQRLKELKDEGVPALEAVSTAMRELGLDAELVTNLSQTATGRISTVKDNLLGIAAAFTQPFFAVFSESLGSLIPKLEEIRPIAENVAEAFSKAFNELQSGVIPLENVVNGFLMAIGVNRELRNQIKEFVIDAQAFVNNGILYIRENVAPLIPDIITWKDVLIGVGIAVATVVVPALLSMAASISAVLLPLTAIIAAVALVRTAWQENWFGIQEITANAVQFVADRIDYGIQFWSNLWQSHGESVMFIVENLWNFIVDRTTLFVSVFTNIFNLFTAAIQGDWESFGVSLGEIARGIWDRLVAVWNYISTDLVKISSDTVDNVVSVFSDFSWSSLGESIAQGLVDGFTAVINGIVQAASNAVSAVRSIASGFSSGFSGDGFAPDATSTQINNSSSTTNNTTNVNFTGNYASTPSVTDQSSLVAIVGGY